MHCFHCRGATIATRITRNRLPASLFMRLFAHAYLYSLVRHFPRHMWRKLYAHPTAFPFLCPGQSQAECGRNARVHRFCGSTPATLCSAAPERSFNQLLDTQSHTASDNAIQRRPHAPARGSRGEWPARHHCNVCCRSFGPLNSTVHRRSLLVGLLRLTPWLEAARLKKLLRPYFQSRISLAILRLFPLPQVRCRRLPGLRHGFRIE